MTQSIFVVDDDTSIRDIVIEILLDEGYQVRGFSNGLDALRALAEGVPSLVVLDMRMPVLNGWEFAREMRERGYDVPVLVMTAAQDARAWAQEIGAVGYIAKPFEVDTFAVAGAIEGSSAGSTMLSALFPQFTFAWQHRLPPMSPRAT